MKPDKVESYPAPDEYTYILTDDEGNSFVYVGEDTFTRLPDGPQKDHVMIVNVATGETTLRHSDDWEFTPDPPITDP